MGRNTDRNWLAPHTEYARTQRPDSREETEDETPT
jgi:hypothetical protein